MNANKLRLSDLIFLKANELTLFEIEEELNAGTPYEEVMAFYREYELYKAIRGESCIGEN